MAASPDEMRRSIDVGSLPFGTRQAFEQGLGEVGSAVPTQGAVRPAAAQAGGLQMPSNPLDPLLAGELDTGHDPLTSGLSVGPGPGPTSLGDIPISDSSVDRLRILAMNASSPVLRNLARRALRGTVKEIRNG